MSETYEGRLAFDSETGFHIDDDGRPVVTDDDGKTWRYAEDADTPHNDRYQTAVAVVDSTANLLLELQLEHGREQAEQLMREQHPHHYEVQPDDPHFNGLRVDPDAGAATVTGHTAAYQ